ncbi:Alpha-galactosidase [Dactylella cylindrospora]|nr:Alpha-galactosidase [Dactylella cylindrospora]
MLYRTASILSALVAIIPSRRVYASDNGLALTPQMGWNTWNTFACNINEDTILGAARALKDLKLDAYGYHYVVMDDCWSLHQRNGTGYLQYDPEKFPRGIKHLADEIHALGLGFGMYSSAGKYTCGRYPGSLGYEQKDADLFAEWEVDYLKYDNCFNEGQSGTPLISYERYNVMSKALNSTGRPILYSMCNWGEDSPWDWAPTIANSWRMSGDIINVFDRYDDRCPCEDYICRLPGHHCSIMNIINKAAPLGQKAHAGAWNDLDMLEIGNENLDYEEQKLHFTIWAMVKSPLIMGHDIMHTSDQTLAILTNTDIIDLSQGKWGVGYRSYKKKHSQLWLQDATDGSGNMVAALINNSEEDGVFEVSFEDIFLDEWERRKVGYQVTDLWTKEDYGVVKNTLKVRVKRHGIFVGKMTFSGDPKEKPKVKRFHAPDPEDL